MVHSLDEALNVAREKEQEEVFVIGGASIYKQFLPMIDRLYLTLVQGTHEADTFFPDYSDFQKVISQEESNNGAYQYTYFILER